MSSSCPFCRIVNREIPAYIITEDEHVIVFLSKENHPLVVPKQHIPNIYTLDELTGAVLMRTIVTTAQTVKQGIGCDGVYVTQANEPAAGQDVFHLHFHVYPRWHNVALSSQQVAVSSEERHEMLERLKAVHMKVQPIGMAPLLHD